MSPMDEQGWDDDVAEPTKALVGTLAVLTRGWAKGVALVAALCLLGVVASSCLLLSKFASVGSIDVVTGLSWTPAALRALLLLLIAGFCCVPVSVARAPAAVSSACGELNEKLNAIRLKEMSFKSGRGEKRMLLLNLQELERAISNVNRGQGLGFELLGVVLDDAKLSRAVAMGWSVLFFLAPFVLATYQGQLETQ